MIANCRFFRSIIRGLHLRVLGGFFCLVRLWRSGKRIGHLRGLSPRYLLGCNRVKVLYVNTERKERGEDIQQNGVTTTHRRMVTCYHLKTEDLETGKLHNMTLELPAAPS